MARPDALQPTNRHSRIERVDYAGYRVDPSPAVVYRRHGEPMQIGEIGMAPGIIGEGGNKRVEGLVYTLSDNRDPYGDMTIAIGPSNMPVTARALQLPNNLLHQMDVNATFREENNWYEKLQAPDAMGHLPVPRTHNGERHIVQEGVELGHGMDEAIYILNRQILLAQHGATLANGDLMMSPEAVRFMLLNLIAGASYTMDSFHGRQMLHETRSLLSGYQWHAIHPLHGDLGDAHLSNLLVEPLKGSLTVIDVSHVEPVEIKDERLLEDLASAGEDVVTAGEVLNLNPKIGNESRRVTHYLRQSLETRHMHALIPSHIWSQPIWSTRDLIHATRAALHEFAASLRKTTGIAYTDEQAYAVAREQYAQAYLWTTVYDMRHERIGELKRSARTASDFARVQYYEDHAGEFLDLPQPFVAAYLGAIEALKQDQPTIRMQFGSQR